jgi:hypothetical protein
VIQSKPYQSAMSRLNFYINRAGANLSEKQKNVLFRAKGELRKAFASGISSRYILEN